MSPLRLAPPDFVLPNQAVTETFGLLAARGAGKSNTAAVMAEEMFRAELHFVVIDPVRAWWGLRSSADGKGPGLPIPIFGGRHGDVPLERTGGALVADLVVDQRLTCILDVSEWDSEAAKKQFLLDFARRLYQKNEKPLHLFLEEADDYIPQKPMGDEAQLLRAWENIVRRGRGRGLGCTLITQRSAALNKNVLTQVQTLIPMRTTGPQDIAAIGEWVKYHQQSKDLLASLPSLEDGEAWVWSPHFLKQVWRGRFRRRATFDSGATPKVEDATRPPATLADVDLAAIEQRMTATIERAKQEDPKELRRRIVELERERVDYHQQRIDDSQRPPERVEVPVLADEQIARLHGCIDRLASLFALDSSPIAVLLQSASEVRDALRARMVVQAEPYPAREWRKAVEATRPDPRLLGPPPAGIAHSRSQARRLAIQRAGPAPAALARGQERILCTIAMLEYRGLAVDGASVARWMDLHPKGGTYRGDLRALRESGHLDDWTLTPKGQKCVTPAATGYEALLAKVSGTRRNILEALRAQKRPVRVDELAEVLNLHPKGGTFRGDLRWLRQMRVITDYGPIALTEGALR